jgi:hypothetical protein
MVNCDWPACSEWYVSYSWPALPTLPIDVGHGFAEIQPWPGSSARSTSASFETPVPPTPGQRLDRGEKRACLTVQGAHPRLPLYQLEATPTNILSDRGHYDNSSTSLRRVSPLGRWRTSGEVDVTYAQFPSDTIVSLGRNVSALSEACKAATAVRRTATGWSMSTPTSSARFAISRRVEEQPARADEQHRHPERNGRGSCMPAGWLTRIDYASAAGTHPDRDARR